MKRAALVAVLASGAALAYIPSAGSLLRKTAARAIEGNRAHEVTLSGMLLVAGEAERPAKLVLRFPLQCTLSRDDGVSLSAKGDADKPAGTTEGTAGPALELLRLACPWIAYRGQSISDAERALRAAAAAAGADPTSQTALTRLGDRPVWVLGAGVREPARPQLWIYKDGYAPARLLAQGGSDLRLLQYGNPAAADWFPRVLELWQNGRLSARFEVSEAHGLRNAAEAEDDDSGSGD